MPLRDHFRPPLSNTSSWEELHGGWPMVIVQQLRKLLPPGYVAGPKVHSGSQVEIDVSTFEKDRDPFSATSEANGGVATAVWVAEPVVRVETELPDDDEYEVRVYDASRGRRLVAAIEIVSPANKDTAPTKPQRLRRQVLLALMRKGVAVSIIDLVTTRQYNLYAGLMTFAGHPDPTMKTDSPHVYAATSRWLLREPHAVLESWSHALAVGQPLPKLPLWLADALVVPLDLEQSYEQACRDLWIA